MRTVCLLSYEYHEHHGPQKGRKTDRVFQKDTQHEHRYGSVKLHGVCVAPDNRNSTTHYKAEKSRI